MTLEQEVFFKETWAKWPKSGRENKESAKKGLQLTINQNPDIEVNKLRICVEMYLQSVTDTTYCKGLGNWFRDDLWKVFYDEFKDLDEYDRKQAEDTAKAEEIIDYWNERRRPHWAEIQARRERSEVIKFALNNGFFKENWKRAIDKMVEIFPEPFEIGDWRRSISITISWFCDVYFSSHTVMKIMEGDLGKAPRPKAEKVFEEMIDSESALSQLFDEGDQDPFSEFGLE